MTTSIKRSTALTIPIIMFAAFFIASAPSANASIIVEGDRQFTDDVNNCFNTYRSAPGLVGDAIRELENSEHEHRILNGTEWNNTSNDLDEATGGSGSGTVTRVDVAALERYKEGSLALANKDFCTALLHEMWHSVDADRGTRTDHDDRVDGVKRNEVEATIFQNLIHAIRGVPPRTLYGGVDISHIVLAGETTMAMSYEHTQPGEYSTVIATIRTTPNAEISVTLSGPAVSGDTEQTNTADANGNCEFRWRITSYGTYVAEGTADDATFSGSVNVQ